MEDKALSEKKAQEMYKLADVLRAQRRIKIGLNEVIKSVNNGTALLVVIAGDSEPPCLVAPLPVLCEQKGVQYVLVDSKVALGRACGLEVSVLSCSIIANKHEDSTKISEQISKALG